MDRHMPSGSRVVSHDHMAPQCAVMPKGKMIADDTIVGNMTVGQTVVVRTDSGELAVFTMGVHRAVLAKNIRAADNQPWGSPSLFAILRFPSDTCIGKYLAIPSQNGVSLD